VSAPPPVSPAPLAVVDVQYAAGGATAACVVAAAWTDAAAIEERVERIAQVAPYRPGAFYERELPCLLAVLAAVKTPVRIVVVDGYVTLDEGRPGLGAHLHERLGGGVAVVGVAKTAYRGAAFATPVERGGSARPLFVTARGIDAAEAARLVALMHGEHRRPTLLARADQLARGLALPGT
jgi:deoxyribonuclease V